MGWALKDSVENKQCSLLFMSKTKGSSLESFGTISLGYGCWGWHVYRGVQ